MQSGKAAFWFALGLLCGATFLQPRPIAEAGTTLRPSEAETVQTIRRVSSAVVSVLTVSVGEDMFFEPVPKQGAGSGVVIDRQGDILTNFHVIGGAQQMAVRFGESRKPVSAHLVGQDPLTDLAIIRANSLPSEVVPARLGDSGGLQVGQDAIAIGNPFGLGRTVTTGVISAIRDIRNDDGKVMRGMLQTDAAINQGNSGGPLLNSNGDVIGINTMIFSPSGGSVGIGFAIPIDRAKRLIPDLLQKGRVIRPWLGLDAFALTPRVAQALRLPVQEGLIVSRLSSAGSLARAGVEPGRRAVTIGSRTVYVGGDVIVAVNDKAVDGVDSLTAAIDAHKVGDTVTVTIVRGGRLAKVRVLLSGPPPKH